MDVMRPVFRQWLSEPPPEGGTAINFFDWNSCNIKKAMPANDSVLIVTTLNLLSANLQPHVDNNEAVAESACLRLLAYAVAWGIGGLCEDEDRRKLHDKLMQVLENS